MSWYLDIINYGWIENNYQWNQIMGIFFELKWGLSRLVLEGEMGLFFSVRDWPVIDFSFSLVSLFDGWGMAFLHEVGVLGPNLSLIRRWTSLNSGFSCFFWFFWWLSVSLISLNLGVDESFIYLVSEIRLPWSFSETFSGSSNFDSIF